MRKKYNVDKAFCLNSLLLTNDMPKTLTHELPALIEFNNVLWTDMLALTYLIFLIGLLGMIYNRKNFLITMLNIEIMYLGLTLSFLIISNATLDPTGQIYALILLIVAAAESAIGLGLLIVLYRSSKTINFSDYEDLKG